MTRFDDTVIPPTAKFLGYTGVLPFLACDLVAVFGAGDFSTYALSSFLAYSAIILSFLGGIRWGVATLMDQFQGRAMIISVLPGLWAFACLIWPDSVIAVWGLMLGFIFLGMADWLLPAPGSAVWMRALRVRLSLAVVFCHLALLISL